MEKRQGSIRFPPFALDLERSVLCRDAGAIEIHATPLRLLIYLVQNRDRMVSKSELLDHVWSDALVSEAAVSSAVNELRRVLGDSGACQAAIRTERGRGYRFVADIECTSGDEPLERGTGRSDRVAVAVLPFVDMSPDRDQEYLADGIAEEIINELVHIHGLLVVARTSSFAFKNTALDIREIGASMGVAAVVEGSVRKENEKLRVSAQLIRTSDGIHLWSETFDHTLGNVLDVETKIAESVALALVAQLIGTISV
jgi:TolB-like protein